MVEYLYKQAKVGERQVYTFAISVAKQRNIL